MFHEDRHPLHGITVVVDTDGPEIYVGRCDTMTEDRVILRDVDSHRDGDDGRSKEDYVLRAAEFGIWKKHDHLVLDRSRVVSVRKLGEL